jgi:hypothetical protein
MDSDPSSLSFHNTKNSSGRREFISVRYNKNEKQEKFLCHKYPA